MNEEPELDYGEMDRTAHSASDVGAALNERIAELERQLADMRETLGNVAHAVRVARMNSPGIRLVPERRRTMALLVEAEERLSTALARAPASGPKGE